MTVVTSAKTDPICPGPRQSSGKLAGIHSLLGHTASDGVEIYKSPQNYMTTNELLTSPDASEMLEVDTVEPSNWTTV